MFTCAKILNLDIPTHCLRFGTSASLSVSSGRYKTRVGKRADSAPSMCDADGTGASALIFQNEKKKGARNGRKN
jgi:hypothetical protein